MPSRLYVRQGGAIGAGSTELTAFTGRKGSPFFDGNDSLIEMGNRCGNGEASQGTFKLMDPDAELPRVDFQFNLPAHTLVTWTEDAPGDEIWLARGRNSSYEGGRGVVLVDNEVEFDATVDDCNVELRGQAFTDPWERPAETDVARLIALQAYTLNGASSTATDHRDTCEVVVSSSHLTPNTNTVSMPAKTYPVGTQPQDVVQDCADTAGKIYGVVIHHTGTGGFTTNVLLGQAAGSIKVSSPGPNPKTEACDGDDATLSHWSSDITDGVDENWWAADLSAATTIARYRVKQGYSVIPAAEPEGASEMRIYGSNSAAAWSWLPSGVLTGDPASNGWTQLASFAGSTTGSDTGPVDFAGGSYRYWLLRASAGPAAGTGEGWNIQEFELRSPLASHLCLLYTIETDHDTYSSAIRISDHLSEWDPTDLTAPVYEPHWEAGKATIYDGQVNLSGLVNIYNASDSIYVSNPSDVDAYDYWVDSYFDSQSTTLTQATLRAGGLLTYRRLTNVTHRVSIIMLPEQTHLVTAGMSIDIKAAAAMGGQYLDTWQTRRIVEHKFEPRYDGTYWCHLDLDRTPHRRVPSSGSVQPAATTPAVVGDLEDVDTTTPPTDGQVLVWDATLDQWVPASVLTNGARIHDLAALHRFLIFANRSYNLNDNGNSGTSYPEDTLEGFRKAAEAGADGVEIDIQQNADGSWVAMHDTTVTRTTSSTGNVNSKTDAQWAALAIDGGFGYNAVRHAGLYTAPFLTDILEAITPYGCLAMLELKGGDELELVQYLTDLGWVERTIISGVFGDTAAMKALNPNITLQHGGAGTGADYDSSSVPTASVVSLAFVQAFAPLWVHSYVPIADFGTDETTIRQDMYDRGVRSWETYDVTGSVAFRDGLTSTATGAPDDATYLVTTAHAGLSAEVAVGATPGGELGGTWASPTVDATHSGSAHHAQTHATAHASGGADAVKLDDLAAPDDNTDLNASTSAHGLLQKLPGGTTNFLRADGTFATPSGTSVGPVVDLDTTGSNTSSVSFVNTNMAVAVAASTNYIFRAIVYFNTNAAAVGIQFAVTVPAGATLKVGQYVPTTASSTTSTTVSIGSTTTSGAVIRATTTGPGASNVMAIIEGTVQVAGTAGSLTLQYASETATQVDIEAGSYLMAQAI